MNHFVTHRWKQFATKYKSMLSNIKYLGLFVEYINLFHEINFIFIHLFSRLILTEFH